MSSTDGPGWLIGILLLAYETHPIWVFPKIGGKPPKWMVKIINGKPYENGMIWGVFPLFLETSIYLGSIIPYNQQITRVLITNSPIHHPHDVITNANSAQKKGKSLKITIGLHGLISLKWVKIHDATP